MHLMPGIAHFDAFTASLHNFVVHLYLYFLVLNVVFFWLIDKLKDFCDPWGGEEGEEEIVKPDLPGRLLWILPRAPSPRLGQPSSVLW